MGYLLNSGSVRLRLRDTLNVMHSEMMLWTSEGLQESYAREGEGNCPFGYIFSALLGCGSSRGNRGSTLLQSKRVRVAAKWHITHFLLLKMFPEIGFCSTKVRNPTTSLSEGSSSREEEFRSPSNPEPWSKGQRAGKT